MLPVWWLVSPPRPHKTSCSKIWVMISEGGGGGGRVLSWMGTSVSREGVTGGTTSMEATGGDEDAGGAAADKWLQGEFV